MSLPLKHYHRITAYDRHAMTPHALDWAEQPSPHKAYKGLETVNLKEPVEMDDADLPALLGAMSGPSVHRPMTLETLSSVCLLANGPTGRSRQGTGWFYYRSPPSAGALYPNELYLVWAGSIDLAAGVYHVDAFARRLTRLRGGIFPEFTATETRGGTAGFFVISGIFFRSAWKYRKRAYRYVLLDGGHLAESTRLALSAAGLPSFVAYDFDDHRVNRLLGLDEKREGAIACIGINGETAFRAFNTADITVAESTAAMLSACRVSRREVYYEEIGDIHSESSRCAASAGVPRIGPDDLGLDVEAWQPVAALSGPVDHPWKMSGTESMVRRRSCRNFVPEALSRPRFEALLDMVCRAYPPPGLENPDAASHVVCTGFLCRNVENLEEGFYLIDPVGRRIGRVRAGALTKAMADACLNQAWLKNAALHFVFMTCLDTLHKHRGARGYRYAMMSAGRMGHVVYLAATALGLGCCGIGAFYDNEAESLMGTSASSALLYLAAAGPVR